MYTYIYTCIYIHIHINAFTYIYIHGDFLKSCGTLNHAKFDITDQFSIDTCGFGDPPF